MCVLASVPFVLILSSLVDMVSDLDSSVPEFEVNESQTLSVSQKGQCHIETRAA